MTDLFLPDLTAALKFPVALSSFGIQRLLAVLPLGDSEAGRKARANLYKSGDSAKREFSNNTLLFGAFQFGDKAQSKLIALASDTLTLKVLRPGYIWNAVSEFVQESTDAFESLATRASRRLLRRQIGNALDVIEFANQVDAPTELSADGSYPIDEWIEMLYARGDYPALWLVEALGERYAQAHMDEGTPVRGLLSSGKGASLPEKSQLMMHAGMGLAFAKHAITRLTPCSSDAEIDDALRMFLDMVEDNSQESCKGAVFESLGFVVRTLYAQMVELVYDRLVLMDGPASEYFWHGAGRAMYFSPMYMLPGFSPWHAAEQEPPNETARLNARAGVAWAFTIVNIRQPEITASLLSNRLVEVSGNDAFTDGAYSALIMAREMVPGHRFVTGYGRYQPIRHDHSAVTRWNQFVGADCEARVDSYRRTLKSHGTLGEVFRYHSLPAFIAGLD